MLVLSRKVGEKVSVGEEIVVQVLEVRGGKVRLGIEAPPFVGVWREEISPLCEPVVSESMIICKPR